MAKLEVRLEMLEEKAIYGVWGKSNDRTVARDIPRLSREYHKTTGTREGTVLPFYVLSGNYDEKSGNAELFIGGEAVYEGLEKLCLPAEEYAVITVKPKLGFLWGLSVGEAKRFFYTQWLPRSGYKAQNLEYEYHTKKTVGRKPAVDVIFAIKKD